MKKTTKRGLIKKIDKIVSEHVRARGSCARCGKGAEQVTLQCAHIFSRRNMSVRFDEENCLSLCFACHFHWAHREPILFTEFVKNYLGEERFSQLMMKSTMIKKWSLYDLQQYLDELTTRRGKKAGYGLAGSIH